MVDTLRSQWCRDMPLEAMIRLRDDLDAMLQQIRREREIRSPVAKCPECGHVGECAPPHVSVRAMILSVIRFQIDDPEATHSAEKTWNAYRKANHLDVYGKPTLRKDGEAEPAHVHSHQG